MGSLQETRGPVVTQCLEYSPACLSRSGALISGCLLTLPGNTLTPVQTLPSSTTCYSRYPWPCACWSSGQAWTAVSSDHTAGYWASVTGTGGCQIIMLCWSQLSPMASMTTRHCALTLGSLSDRYTGGSGGGGWQANQH